MAVQFQPIFPKTVQTAVAANATANTNRDGTGTIADIFTAGADGSFINSLVIKATVTTTSGMVRFYVHNGSAWFLWHEENVTPVTVGAANPGEEIDVEFFKGMALKAGWKLGYAPHNAENFNAICVYGDY